MTKNDALNKELVLFYLDYISKHSYFKIRTLVKIYIKTIDKIENAKLRNSISRSLSVRFAHISAKAIKLNLVEKDNKVYKILKNNKKFVNTI